MSNNLFIEKINKSLFLKITLIFSIAIIITGVIALLIGWRQQHNYFYQNAENDNESLLTLLELSVDDSMLSNNRDKIQHAVSSITKIGTVKNAMIYTPSGITAFHSNESLKGKIASVKQDGCIECHSKKPLPLHTITSRNNAEYLRSFKLLNNKPLCYSCHSKEQKILGFIILDMPLLPIKQKISRLLLWRISSTIALLLILELCLIISIRKLIHAPLNKLNEHIAHLITGDLRHPLASFNKDEIGTLASNINVLSTNLTSMLHEFFSLNSTMASTSEQLGSVTQKLNVFTLKEDGQIYKVLKSINSIRDYSHTVKINQDSIASSSNQSVNSLKEINKHLQILVTHFNQLKEFVAKSHDSITDLFKITKLVSDKIENLNESGINTVNSIQEFEKILTEIKDISTNAFEFSKVAETAAREGDVKVQNTYNNLNMINEQIQNASTLILKLGEQAIAAGTILAVIEDIADQTNLLSLNAAILAAQAGEEGKGFSVVANEIKELAQKTRNSIHEISEIIRAVQDSSKSSVNIMNSVSHNMTNCLAFFKDLILVLKKIEETYKKSAEFNAKINKAIEEQTSTINYIKNITISVKEQIEDMHENVNLENTHFNEIKNGLDLLSGLSEELSHSTNQHFTSINQLFASEKETGQLIEQSFQNIKDLVNDIHNIETSINSIKEISKGNISIIKVLSDNTNNLAAKLSDAQSLTRRFKI
ncbi:MAG: hypothetical protein A2Y62_15005 [Candidatus Fischerbacteria bacterium RBG_13_37_8]|uniref:Methyl-accepting transducer domain-containing protein n=1 Tax=Candidatus Fischerbacteria bacterium RBG_13_37_8 TaxID=1817863 RepID=A0A1F5V4Q3_9BACT|nr:MAG: hypothetical protein A2Y62_15005 [Candidatus Fischerbacteria bacterium RBG_13_37_8]